MSSDDKYLNSDIQSEMNSDIRSEIEAVLDEHVRPYLAAHDGDMKVDGVEGGVVFFHLMGRYVGCAAADQTSEGLIADQQSADGTRAGHQKSHISKRHQPGDTRADAGTFKEASQFLKRRDQCAAVH